MSTNTTPMNKKQLASAGGIGAVLSAVITWAGTQGLEPKFNEGYLTQQEATELDKQFTRIEDSILVLVNADRDINWKDATSQLQKQASAYRTTMEVAYLIDLVPKPVTPEPEPEPDPGPGPQPDPAVLYYDLDQVFGTTGVYSHLGAIPDDELRGAVYGGPFGYWSKGACWTSDKVCAFPPELWGATVIYNNAAASWGEHGPKWGSREYNVTGVIEGVSMWRPGDWTKGREGHAWYLNVYRDLTFRNCNVSEAGACAYYFEWRDGTSGSHDETDIPWDEAQNWLYEVALEDCTAIDCGQINFGTAVRASWPVNFCNPGQRFRIDGMEIKTEFPPVTVSGETFQSHGGVFVGPGQADKRCPLVTIDDLMVDVTRSDRQELVLWAVDEAIIGKNEPIGITDVGGRADVAIVAWGEDACGSVTIYPATTDLYVGLYEDHPHKPAKETIFVPAGTEYFWQRN